MKKKFLTLAVLATIFAACSNNDVPQADSLKDTPIIVTAAVTELSSRAGYEGTSVLPEIFYLSIDQTGTNYDYTDVVMTKGAGNAYTPASQLLWSGDKAVKVTAATFLLEGAQDLGVQTNQSTADAIKASDHLLMEKKDVTPSTEGISVEFSHIMSKVLLTITLGDEFNEKNNPVTDVTFKGTVASNTYTEGTWGTIADEATDITAWEGAYTPINLDEGIKNATAEYEVILVPQTIDASTFTVVFNVGDRVFRWTSANEVKLESGYKYTLALTVGKDKVSSATFSSYAWKNGDKLNGETE